MMEYWLSYLPGVNEWSGLIIHATLVTFLLSTVALIIGAVIGGVVAASKLSSSFILNRFGHFYSIIFRGVPELLIIYLFYFGSSSLVTTIGQMFGHEGFVEVPPFLIGALAIGMISASYQGEVYRSARLAIDKGQIEAGLAIGMSKRLIVLRILFPHILRLSLPGLSNVWQMTLKDSALISVTGVVELMRASQVISGSTGEYIMYYSIGGGGYLLLTLVTNRIFERSEQRLNHSYLDSDKRGRA